MLKNLIFLTEGTMWNISNASYKVGGIKKMFYNMGCIELEPLALIYQSKKQEATLSQISKQRILD